MTATLKVRGHKLLSETIPAGIHAWCECSAPIPFSLQDGIWPSGKRYQESQRGIYAAHREHVQDVLAQRVVNMHQIASQLPKPPPSARVNGRNGRTDPERVHELRRQAQALIKRHCPEPDLLVAALELVAQKHPMDVIRAIHQLQENPHA